MGNDFAFILTNYNNSEVTKTAVISISSQDVNSKIHIVIVDNNSVEIEKEKLKSIRDIYPSLIIIFNAENLGYFGGLNVGLEYLKKTSENLRYIVIGNNDLIFDRDFCNSILKNSNLFVKYPVVCPNIELNSGGFQNPHVIHGIGFLREFIYSIYYSNYFFSRVINFFSTITRPLSKRTDFKSHDLSMEIYQGHGSCYILGPLFIDEFCYLFSPTFLMFEEFFLTYQIIQKGYKLYYCSNIHLIHDEHSSTGNIPSKMKWAISKESYIQYRFYLKKLKYDINN